MKILYLGDNAGTSAEYLKDVLKDLEHEVTHVDSQTPCPDINDTDLYHVIIVSDYPAKQLTEAATAQIRHLVEKGARLIMLGGWDSFNGRGTNYAGHPLAELLPVQLQQEDDRVNAPQGLILSADENLDRDFPLDWQTPPVICGYNSVEAKPEAEHWVWASPIQTDGSAVSLLQRIPLVVKGKHNEGVVVACMTDVAPHWCGGLVDWGNERRALEHVEVGDMYIQFIRFLLELTS